MARGPVILLTVNAGYRELPLIGRRIDRVSGFGYLPPVGPGLQASAGDGRLTTMVDGRSCRDSDGHGCPASVQVTADMVTEITIGGLGWFPFSTARHRAVAMLVGIRLRRASVGTDLIVGDLLGTDGGTADWL